MADNKTINTNLLTVDRKRLTAIAYYAVGMATEAGKYAYSAVVNAGGASGFSMGVAQVDFRYNKGDRNAYANAVVDYLKSKGEAPSFTATELAAAIEKKSLNSDITAGIKEFGLSDVGQEWITTKLDMAHLDRAVSAAERALATDYGQAVLKEGAHVEEFVAFAMKVFNQYGAGASGSNVVSPGFEGFMEYITSGTITLRNSNPNGSGPVKITAQHPGKYDKDDLLAYGRGYADTRAQNKNDGVYTGVAKAVRAGELFGDILDSDTSLTDALKRAEQYGNFSPLVLDEDPDMAIMRAVFGADLSTMSSKVAALSSGKGALFAVNSPLGEIASTLWIDPVSGRVAVVNNANNHGWVIDRTGNTHFDSASVEKKNGKQALNVTAADGTASFVTVPLKLRQPLPPEKSKIPLPAPFYTFPEFLRHGGIAKYLKDDKSSIVTSIAKSDDSDGLFKAGDQVTYAYDKDRKVTGRAVVHIADNSVETEGYDLVAGTALYTKVRDGKVLESYTYQIGDIDRSPIAGTILITNDVEWEVIFADRSTWTTHRKGTDDPPVQQSPQDFSAPAGLESAPTQQEAEDEALRQMGGDPEFNTDAQLDGTAANMLGFVPQGSAEEIAHKLESLGFTVAFDKNGLTATHGDDYLAVSEGLLEMRFGDRWTSIELTGDSTVVRGSDVKGHDFELRTTIGGHIVEFSGDDPDLTDESGRPMLVSLDAIDGHAPLDADAVNGALIHAGISVDEVLDGGSLGKLSELVHAADPADGDGYEPIGDGGDDGDVGSGGGDSGGSDEDQAQHWWENKDVKRISGDLTDTQSLVAALRSHKTLPIATAVFNVAASRNNDVAWLGTVATGLNSIGTLLTFRDALRKGDTLSIIGSGANLANMVMKTYANYLGDQLIAQYGDIENAISVGMAGDETAAAAVSEYEGAASAAGDLSSTVGYIGAAVSIFQALGGKHPNYMEAIMAAVSVIPGYGQIIYAAYQADKVVHAIFDKAIGHDLTAVLFGPLEEITGFVNDFFGGLFGTDIDIRGDASVVSDGDGVHVHAVVTHSQDGGDRAVLAALSGMVSALQKMLDGNKDLGLVASRMPSLHFVGFEDGGGYFVMEFRDPVTGAVSKRTFDMDGNFTAVGDNLGHGISAADALLPNGETAYSADFDRSMAQQFIDMAFSAGAVVPKWMVETIDAQSHRGQDVVNELTGHVTHTGPANDLLAGLNTLQRAAALGQLLGSDPGDGAANDEDAKQTARPIVLDLDGNGIGITPRDTGGSVLIDVDDDGFAEEADWLNPRDGILVLDRDGDGRISGGHEMFSDSRVDMARRGLHALDEIDADGDGRITSADAVFSALRVWQDINHDGLAQDYELSSLQQRGITELDIDTGRFVMGGQSLTMSATPLQADSAGFITQVAGNGIFVVKEGGAEQDRTSLMVSAVADYGQAIDDGIVVAHTHRSADGRLAGVDELMDGAEDTVLTISVEQLLDNDHSADGPIRFAGLGAVAGGTASFDADSNTITFRPSADYSGMAQFEYLVQDGAGHEVRTTAYVDLETVNDAPVVRNDFFDRAAHWEDMGSRSVGGGPEDGPAFLVYSLPEGALLGDALSDTGGIVTFNSTDSAGGGAIGFRNGEMFFGQESTQGSITWRPVILRDNHTGTIAASDLETPAGDLKFKLLSDVHYGALSFNERTGAWHYVNGVNDGRDDAFPVQVLIRSKAL